MKRIILNCHYCNKSFEKEKGQYNKEINLGRTYFFCSLSCSTGYRQKKLGEVNHQKYKEKPNICLFCNKDIILPENTRLSDIRVKKFCNSSCASKYNNSKREIKNLKHCLNCGKELTSRVKKYCNNSCQINFKYTNYIENWKKGKESGTVKDGASITIRKYLFEKYSNKCCLCGWSEINLYTQKIPLQVDHIDGNYLNNKEENLRLLCPNCHALTSTYGFLNKGKGRDSRRVWRKVKKQKQL